MRSLYKIIFVFAFILAGCKSSVDVKIPASKNSSVHITNVQIIDHQIVITGSNLNTVTVFRVNDGGTVTPTAIQSQTASRLVANTLSNVTFAAGKVLDFVLSDASAAPSTFTVNFSMCDALFNGRGFDCTLTADEGDVLTYNGTSHKWEPRSLNLSGLQYKGTWDASDPAGFPSGAATGEYYIVSVAANVYNIGDWIVYDSALGAFEHIRNSASKQEGDYSLTQLADVDLSSPTPTNGMVLKYDGATSTWIPGTVTAGGSGTVTTVSVTPPLAVSNASTTPALSISQANTSTNGYLSSADWNTFNNKEAALPSGGTTSQYLRGDKTLATLNTSAVPESGALYFTEARTRSTQLTGINTSLAGTISASDSILQAIGKAQNQISALSSGGSNYLLKNSSDTLSGDIILSGSIDATGLGEILVGTPSGLTSAVNVGYVNTAVSGKLDKGVGGTVTASVSFDTDIKLKGSSNSNYVTARAHASTAAYNFVFPASAGTSGHVLSTDGSGNTSWIPMSGGGGAVSSVNTQTGAVVLTTDEIAQGLTNLYYTNAHALGTTITAPTLTNSAIAVSDTIQVAFGKLQAQLNNVVSRTLTGLAAGTNTVIAAGDTLLVALANLQGQITYLGTNKADVTNGSQAITAATVTATTVNATNLSVANGPLAATDVANRAYVEDVMTWAKGASNASYYNAGKVGIGTSTPVGRLHMFNSTANGEAAILLEHTANATSGGDITFWKHRNYSATQSGDELGYMQFIGHDGSGLRRSAYFAVRSETPTAGSVPATMGFFTTSPGETDSTEKLHIASSGNIGIGVSLPVARLDVAGEIKFGNTSSTCNSTNEGQQRYNSTSKVMEFCNGTAWTEFGSGGGGGGGGGGGTSITACPSGFSFVPASNTFGANAFCIDTVKKVPNPIGLGNAMKMCASVTGGAQICKNRQLSAALEYLPAASLEANLTVWTGDISMGEPKYVGEFGGGTMVLSETNSGSRTIGQKGVYLGPYTPSDPSNSGHPAYCCID